jgi:hypothetical protein
MSVNRPRNIKIYPDMRKSGRIFDFLDLSNSHENSRLLVIPVMFGMGRMRLGRWVWRSGRLEPAYGERACHGAVSSSDTRGEWHRREQCTAGGLQRFCAAQVRRQFLSR